jgi:hypothetical protein
MVTQVYTDEVEVVPLLTKMRLPRWAILEIAAQIAGERANVSPDDAPPVVGFETWRWGTRFCREQRELKKLKWVLCEANQVSGIRNDALRMKLVFCSTNANTGNPKKAPKNLNEKGPASCRLIERNSGQLSFLPEDDSDRIANYALWYLCCYFCDAYVSIEISRPSSEANGFVTGFSDRIIVAKPFEIPGIRRDAVPQDFADVPKPKVTRKGA